jgi:YVTN family beta-propeller protein
VDAALDRIYIASYNVVSVFDSNTNKILSTINVESSGRLVVDPLIHRVYVVQNNYSGGDQNISIIDGEKNQLLSTVKVGKSPTEGIGVDTAAHRIYALDDWFHSEDKMSLFHGTVSVIDGVAGKVTSTIKLKLNLSEAAVDPTTHTVYISGQGSSDGTGNADTDASMVMAMDGRTHRHLFTLPIGGRSIPGEMAVDPAIHRVYVADNLTGSAVSVLDSRTGKVVSTLEVGEHPEGIAVDTATHRVYVAVRTEDYRHGEIAVIDGGTNTVVSTIKMEDGPVAVAVDSTTHKVYVTLPHESPLPPPRPMPITPPPPMPTPITPTPKAH